MAAFMNGTVEGEDVFIPMACLIGGQVHFLLICICNFHVISNLLLIYICKLHWNLISPGVRSAQALGGICLWIVLLRVAAFPWYATHSTQLMKSINYL